MDSSEGRYVEYAHDIISPELRRVSQKLDPFIKPLAAWKAGMRRVKRVGANLTTCYTYQTAAKRFADQMRAAGLAFESRDAWARSESIERTLCVVILNKVDLQGSTCSQGIAINGEWLWHCLVDLAVLEQSIFLLYAIEMFSLCVSRSQPHFLSSHLRHALPFTSSWFDMCELGLRGGGAVGARRLLGRTELKRGLKALDASMKTQIGVVDGTQVLTSGWSDNDIDDLTGAVVMCTDRAGPAVDREGDTRKDVDFAEEAFRQGITLAVDYNVEKDDPTSAIALEAMPLIEKLEVSFASYGKGRQFLLPPFAKRLSRCKISGHGHVRFTRVKYPPSTLHYCIHYLPSYE